MHFSTAYEWLAYISTLHTTEIELGLDRVKRVAQKLDLLTPGIPVVIVGGTNGKGSTVTGLEAIYRAAGYHVGAFTSPFLFKHNEQVRINGADASDDMFCNAFAEVEKSRGEISLTPFEFTTLAALWIFKSQELDILLLEVGLGGRLDAVNIVDADVSVITSIGIDHVEWLGPTREHIALEKAGILRENKPAVCGDLNPPAVLINYADEHRVPLFCSGKNFRYEELGEHWSFAFEDTHYDDLPINTLATQNMASVVMAITLLQKRLPVPLTAIQTGLRKVTLTGRIQIIPGPVTKIFDVSHNPDSVALLAKRLRTLPCQGRTLAVFSMLGDKDIAESLNGIKELMDIWFVAPLTVKRAASAEKLRLAFAETNISKTLFFASIQEAYLAASMTAKAGDRIIIFGSFHTIADVYHL